MFVVILLFDTLSRHCKFCLSSFGIAYTLYCDTEGELPIPSIQEHGPFPIKALGYGFKI